MESAAVHINKWVGAPWVQGADDPIRDGGLDCWGAVTFSFKCIDCVTLPDVFNRDECDLNGSAQKGLDDYIECDCEDGAIFCCYDESGAMVHIGRILLGKAYHAVGTPEDPRSVALWDIKTLLRVYNDRVKYYRYKGE